MPEKRGGNAASATQEANNPNKKLNDKTTWFDTNIPHTPEGEDNNYNKGSLFERKKITNSRSSNKNQTQKPNKHTNNEHKNELLFENHKKCSKSINSTDCQNIPGKRGDNAANNENKEELHIKT